MYVTLICKIFFSILYHHISLLCFKYICPPPINQLTHQRPHTMKVINMDAGTGMQLFVQSSHLFLCNRRIYFNSGLWMADLVVTQLMQESIVETERGIVHGVQNSLNMFMDMLKFILVIVLPQIEIFGVHIILSFSFICLASLFFLCHASKAGKICNGVEKHKLNTNGNVVVWSPPRRMISIEMGRNFK